MAAHSFSDLQAHVGHDIQIIEYGNVHGDIHNVAIACENCQEILLDFDNPELEEAYA